MTELSDYTPPRVWQWEKASGGRFAEINRPVAGPTHDKELPVGRHPLQLYSLATPNGVKVTVLLEELLRLLSNPPFPTRLQFVHLFLRLTGQFRPALIRHAPCVVQHALLFFGQLPILLTESRLLGLGPLLLLRIFHCPSHRRDGRLLRLF